MDWTVILDGFVLLMQAGCLLLLVYGFWLWHRYDDSPGREGPTRASVDVEALVQRAHHERSQMLGLFIVRLPGRAWRCAARFAGSLLGRVGGRRVC